MSPSFVVRKDGAMLIKDIVSGVNGCLAGELLSYNEVRPYLDKTIDDINTQLNSKYPVFSELPVGTAEYTLFPDQFIRQVVIPGAAWYYYVADEEGSIAAQQYQQDYYKGLFIITRDLIYGVPLEYQVDTPQGSAQLAYELDGNAPGIIINSMAGEW